MTLPTAFAAKILAPGELTAVIGNCPRPLVFTNGCFDIIHRGHVTYLAEAKSFGKTLLVALNSDISVRGLNKGKNRPINPLSARLDVVAALASVDYVTWFDESNPLALINLTKPDILVKGGDWSVDSMVGAAETRQRGGRVISVPFRYETSTSKIIERIVSGF